jgi:alkanesulfonate monooxygenase SsuD/methylene tetrahydromethanopterin reductase-like flavin-dependent oxidoreductase (luciferase family)
MQLCLMIEGQEGVTWPGWLALARACEWPGVPALFRSDHYLNVDGRDDRGSLDAWGTICGLAAATSRLRLGTMVTPVTFRHPSVLAKLVTTADHITNGRVELGLGAGWHAREHEAYGFPFPAAGARSDLLADQLAALTGLWGEGPFSLAGRQVTLAEVDALPRPVQRPHPPIILGGAAGPRGARLAAAFADEYNTPEPTLEQVRQRRRAIEGACEAAARPMMRFSIMTGVIVEEHERALATRLSRVAALVGADPLRLRRDPPAGWIVGTLDDASEQLTAMREAGVDRIMCQQPDFENLDAVAFLGEVLAPLVA